MRRTEDPAPKIVPWMQRAAAPERSTDSTDFDLAEVSRATELGRPSLVTSDPRLDAALLAILGSPLDHGETFQVAYQRKEIALRDLFASLDVGSSRAMHARLSAPKPGDEVASMFGRMIAERRGRLLAFLADVRRRHAIAARGSR